MIQQFKDMGEAIISLIIALAVFIFGYGILSEKVRSNKNTADERHNYYVKELDELKASNVHLRENLNDILVTLQKLSSDIGFIKETIKK